MSLGVIFHRLVQRDMDGILRYYSGKGGSELSDRFYDAFMRTADIALDNPSHFHPLHGFVRIAAIKGFPYHFLYRKAPYGIRILVLRHNSKHWNYGLRRK